MEAVIALAFMVGAGAWLWGVIGRMRGGGAAKQTAQAAGSVAHLRSGYFSASCSWCQKLSTAKKLLVYRNQAGEGGGPSDWHAFDLHRTLSECPEADVLPLAAVYEQRAPGWRKFCGEKCVREFFDTEGGTARDVFVSCGYCQLRASQELIYCPHCGAPRQ